MQARRTLILFDSGLDREFRITEDQANKYRHLSDAIEKKCVDFAKANHSNDQITANRVADMHRPAFFDMDISVKNDILTKQQMDKYLSWSGSPINVDF